MLLRILVASSLCFTSLATVPAFAQDPTPGLGVTAGSWLGGGWRVHQRNNNGAEYTGTLTFTQQGNGVSGHANWDNHADGSISGTIEGNRVIFSISYPGGLVGTYVAYVEGGVLSHGSGHDHSGAQVCVWSGWRI